MRIWSLHPKYLDAKGLVACWRETLLARHVLLGLTRGYRNHPQLERFRACDAGVADGCLSSPAVMAIDAYLTVLYQEAISRHYKFDSSKFVPTRVVGRGNDGMPLSEGPPKKRGRKRQRGDPFSLAAPPACDSATAGTASSGISLLATACPPCPSVTPLTVTDGQVAFEVDHLLRKLSERDPPRHALLVAALAEREHTAAVDSMLKGRRAPALPSALAVHPLFDVVEGGVEPWERR